MHAVGADDDVGGRARAVRESQLDARRPLLDPDAPVTEMESVVAQVLAERLQQRHPVHAVVGRPERGLVDAVAPDRMIGDDLAGAPVADHERARHHGHGLDLLAETEPPQLARPVGRQRDGGADLAQLVRRFVDVAADAALAQREREHQPADPAADDRDLHRLRRSPACARGRARSRR